MVLTMPIFSLVGSLCFSVGLGCGKLKGLGELMHILNASYGKVCLDIKYVGRARFPTCL